MTSVTTSSISGPLVNSPVPSIWWQVSTHHRRTDGAIQVGGGWDRKVLRGTKPGWGGWTWNKRRRGSDRGRLDSINAEEPKTKTTRGKTSWPEEKEKTRLRGKVKEVRGRRLYEGGLPQGTEGTGVPKHREPKSWTRNRQLEQEQGWPHPQKNSRNTELWGEPLEYHRLWPRPEDIIHEFMKD